MASYNLRSSKSLRVLPSDDTRKAGNSALDVDDKGKSDSTRLIRERSREVKGRQTRLQRIVARAYPHDSIFINGTDTGAYRMEGNPSIGYLQFVMQVPFDIFNEISSYLSVLDLLNLSYSSWNLHDILLSKSFRPVWRTALREIGAPECPSDMNEPQFAGLILFSFCQACGTPEAEKVKMGLRIRLCVRCASINLITGGELLDRAPGVSKVDIKILRLFFYDGLEFAETATTSKESDEGLAQKKYLVPDFEDVARKYSTFKQGSRRQRAFVADRHKLLNDMWTHAKETQSWLSKLDPTGLFSSPCDNLRAHLRKTSILRRLKDIGYTFGDIYVELVGEERTRWREMVLRPVDLTETELSDILPKVEGVLQLMHERFMQDLRDVYDEFFQMLEEDDYLGPIMSFEEAKQLPEVQEIIERRKVDVKSMIEDEERDAIQHLFREANVILGDLIKQNCAAAIRSARETADLPPLAETSFEADERVLHHASTFFLDVDAPFDFKMQTYSSLIEHRKGGPAWRPLDPQCPKVIKVASTLLNALNLPENVDMNQMLDHGRRFVCKRCRHDLEWQMNWKELVHHFVRESKWFERVSEQLAANPGLKLNVIDSHNTNASDDLVEIAVTAPNGFPHQCCCSVCSGRKYCCNLCRDTVPEFTIEDAEVPIEAHIRRSHGIQDPTADHYSRP